jgi:hypothetical protein
MSASCIVRHKNVAYNPSAGRRTPDGPRFKTWLIVHHYAKEVPEPEQFEYFKLVSALFASLCVHQLVFLQKEPMPSQIK